MRGGNFHYHLGLVSGENTLEAQLTRLLCRTMTTTNGFDAVTFRNAYMKFMQTPGSHNDTYASTCHRMFFSNLIAGKAPENCADNDG
jgi:ADP-ribosyl-[dinitrogen reductase] hydrolase